MKETVKSKEFKILIYFIIIAIVVVMLDRVYSDYYTKMNNYEWKGADVDGDGVVGDVEGYGYLFGGFAKDIVGEISSGLKTGITLLPLTIKIYAIPTYVVFQMIAIIIKKKKKVLSNVALALSLASSIFALFLSVFGNVVLIKGIIIFDMIGAIILISYNNEKEEKIDLYTLD